MNDPLLSLVQTALNDLDNLNTPLSSVIRKCVRIARIREDYTNLLWLELELVNYNDKQAMNRIHDEIREHFSQDDFHKLLHSTQQTWKENRRLLIDLKGGIITVDDGNVYYNSIVELENDLRLLDNSHVQTDTDQYDHVEQDKRRYSALISRTSHRIYAFLSITEKTTHERTTRNRNA
jgi:hypothetical protein